MESLQPWRYSKSNGTQPYSKSPLVDLALSRWSPDVPSKIKHSATLWLALLLEFRFSKSTNAPTLYLCRTALTSYQITIPLPACHIRTGFHRVCSPLWDIALGAVLPLFLHPHLACATQEVTRKIMKSSWPLPTPAGS